MRASLPSAIHAGSTTLRGSYTGAELIARLLARRPPAEPLTKPRRFPPFRRYLGSQGAHLRAGTASAFEGMGIPAPSVSAAVVTGAELIGGALLIVGLITSIAAAVNAVAMVIALIMVHAPAGVFVDQGGFELVLALFAGLLVLVAFGAGRFSADHALTSASRPRKVSAGT